MKSNSTNLYWIKTVEHDGTENLASNSTIPHSYNRISHCPFCGNVIVENLQWIKQYISSNNKTIKKQYQKLFLIYFDNKYFFIILFIIKLILDFLFEN